MTSTSTSTLTFDDMVLSGISVHGIHIEIDPKIRSSQRWRIYLTTRAGTLRSLPMDYRNAKMELQRLCLDIGRGT